jgi:magnesium chelatase family protein
MYDLDECINEILHDYANYPSVSGLFNCGYHGHYNGKCRCTPDQISRYRSKISGPLLDRIDIQIEVPAVPQDDLLNKAEGEASADLQARIEIARQHQLARQNKANAQLTVTEIDALCTPDAQGVALLQQALSRLNLSARAYHRVLKVARSIADLEEADHIATRHIAEAIQYRRFNL